jgi:probable F420-dependent oxidoreductase
MKLSMNLRNWGPHSTADIMRECAQAADESGLDTLWINEHIAIPPKADMPDGVPDFAEGRNLDPFATLAFLAAATKRIGLGTAVILLPYRPPLPTAKLVATVQELSGGRLRLGVGVGWMKEEFRALGVDYSRRGAITNEILAFLRHCFDGDDTAEANGQPFLFRPRPTRPPIYVGGAPPHSLQRAITYGDGWIPAGVEPEVMKPNVERLSAMAQEAGRPPLEIIAMKTLPIDDPPKAIDYANQFAEAGATHLVHTQGYESAAEYRRNVEILEEKIRPALAA